jgi:hypothetical protein
MENETDDVIDVDYYLLEGMASVRKYQEAVDEQNMFDAKSDYDMDSED